MGWGPSRAAVGRLGCSTESREIFAPTLMPRALWTRTTQICGSPVTPQGMSTHVGPPAAVPRAHLTHPVLSHPHPPVPPPHHPPRPVLLSIALASLDLTSKQPRDLIPWQSGVRGAGGGHAAPLHHRRLPGMIELRGGHPHGRPPAPPRPAFPWDSQLFPMAPARMRPCTADGDEMGGGGSHRFSSCPASPAPAGRQGWAAQAGTGCRPFWVLLGLRAWLWEGFPEFSGASETHPGQNIPAGAPLLRWDPAGTASRGAGCPPRPVSRSEGRVHGELHPHHSQGPGARRKRRMAPAGLTQSPVQPQPPPPGSQRSRTGFSF